MSNPAEVKEPQAAEPGSDLFAAIEQQLGLKLEPRKMPGELLVIDRVERPSAN